MLSGGKWMLMLCFLFLQASTFAGDHFVEVKEKLKAAEQDSSGMVSQDSIAHLRKELRKEKTKRVFKFISYFNYYDRGYGKDFSGAEKYNKYRGKKISCVDIVVFKPFGCTEDSCPAAISKAQKFGNAIHFRSREWYIRGDIFFQEGDTVNPTLFADTEKLLWERKKFKDVRILIMPDSLQESSVEVMVYLQDNLSWMMAAGYSQNRVLLSISTFNFFGLPHSLRLFTGVNFNKYDIWAFGGIYKYENIQSSQINFQTQFVVQKLNQNVLASINRNFFSLKSRWAFDAKYVYNNQTLSLTGNPRDPSSFVGARSHYYSLWMAYADPVEKVMSCKDSKLKFVLAAKLDYTDYRSRPFIINDNFNESFIRQQNYMFGVGLARWDYYLERNAFYIDIAEYFPRGLNASLWAGTQVDEILGRRTHADLTLNYGIYFRKFGYLLPQANYSSYIRDRKGEQMHARFDLNYVSKRVSFARHMYFRQVLKAESNLGFFVPEERYFNINDLNGIRGFYSPSLKGSKSFLLSAECDLFLDKTVLMTRGMGYVFCDMGWLSRNGEMLIKDSPYQYGIGVGLRIRSVDLGLPYLDFQFSVYPKGKDFGALPFQFKLYETNLNAIMQNNMFVEPTFY